MHERQIWSYEKLLLSFFISVGLAAGKEILSCGSDGLLILRLIDLISERHYFQGKKEKLSKVRG